MTGSGHDPRGPAVGRGWVRVLILVPVLAASVIAILVPLELWLRHLGAPPLQRGGDELVVGVELVRHLGSLAATVLAVYLMCRAIDRRPLRELLGSPTVAGIAEGAAWGGGLVAAVLTILLVTGRVGEPRWVGAGSPAELTAVALLLLVASISEELLFRAYVQVNLSSSLGRWPAVAVASLMFAFAHRGNPDVNGIGFLSILLAGVLLGVFYYRRRRFWPAVALHFGWNFVQGPLCGFDVSGLDIGGLFVFETTTADRWTGGEFGLEGSLVSVLVLVVGIGLVALRERG